MLKLAGDMAGYRATGASELLERAYVPGGAS